MDVSVFFSAWGGEGGVRGARKGAGVGFFIENPRGGGSPREGREAWRVSVGNLGGGGLNIFQNPVTLFALFSHIFRIFPSGLSPSKQRVLAQ